MTWLALVDAQERRLSRWGLGDDKQALPVVPDDPAFPLLHGTLMLETRLPTAGRPDVLFGYQRLAADRRSLTLQARPGGGIALVQVQGDRIGHAALAAKSSARTDVLRLTFSWDFYRNWAQLTVETPGEIGARSALVDHPMPLTLGDVRDLMLGRAAPRRAPEVIFAALSDRVEPIGPMPGLLPSTAIETAEGFRPLGDLRRGDILRTRDSGLVPVLQPVRRTVPARGSFRPIRLRAPYFGLRQDIIVSPEERLVIDGPEVEYLFGREAVLVPARHLVNGRMAVEETCGPTATYTQVILPRHDTLMVAGTQVESLYLGRIRRQRALLSQSLLADYPRDRLPEHAHLAWPVLRWHDAIHLARRRAA
ncbi:MAG: Hint domain-containing protein [Pseudomonadota bacterium]